MYQAEIHSKLPSHIAELEDVLTSDVFSFFKYADRSIFLKRYLHKLGFYFSDSELNSAEFLFWPRFDDNTEPDLVLLVGDYYLLIEAKFKSGFDKGTDKIKPQLIREIEGGLLESKNYRKKFKLIAITKDHYYRQEKFSVIPKKYESVFMWTNWQEISTFLLSTLENEKLSYRDVLLAQDLYNTLDKKNLRSFRSITDIYQEIKPINSYDSLFLKANTTKYRGAFIGFSKTLLSTKKIVPFKDELFKKRSNTYFETLVRSYNLKSTNTNLFYTNN